MLTSLGFFISYGIIYFFIERFLYHKVKIIFKTIHSLRSSADGKPKILMSQDLLHDINSEVADWADEKIKEVKELRSAENFRREFIGNLAHELKTPLFNIQGYVDTLIESDLSDPSITRKFLERASTSCERLSSLILDLDQIANIESGNFSMQPEKFDVVALARKVIESLESISHSKGITLKLRNPQEKPIMVDADPKRIEQVFTNLLVNSVNYGTPSGETRIHFYDMDSNVLIELADNGIGIAAEHLPRLFERFYRVDKSRSRHEGGSGLGLAICKHILDYHNQTISVRSTEGVGSTFAFTLKKAS